MKTEPATMKSKSKPANSAEITPTAISNEGLPDGWRWVRLGDISDKVASVKRTTQNPKAEFFYLDIGGIDHTRNKILDHKVYTWKDAPSRAQQIVRKNDILFSTVRTYMKNIAIIDQEIYNEQIASSGFCVIRAKSGEVNPKYIFYLTLSNIFLQPLNELQTGSSYPAVRDKDVFSQFVPLPTLDKQHAIVSKIEELLSELDKGKQQLETAHQQLKIYRQAVLKWAFDGKLSEDWRKVTQLVKGQDVLIKIKNERIEKLKNLASKESKEYSRILSKIEKHKFKKPENTSIPNEWCWSSFLTACFLVVDCHNKTAPYQDDGIYLIRTSNIKNGKLLLGDKMKFVSEETYNYWSRRCPPEPGDILFTREAPMGEAAIIPNDTKVCMGQRIMLLRTFPDLLQNKYVYYAIMESAFQRRMNNSAIGTGVKHMRVGDVEGLVFPLCSPEEQERIVQEIESRLSVCDKVEETITTSLQQAETLRQSILKKAFEGKLV